MAQNTSAFATNQFTIVLVILQIVFLVVFILYGAHQLGAMPGAPALPANEIQVKYTDFQDIHLLLVVGLSFIVAFLRRYGFASFTISLLLIAVTIEWAVIVRGLLSDEFGSQGKFAISVYSLVPADFTVAVVLISFGALVGKLSPIQYLFLTVIETPVSIGVEHLLLRHLAVQDIGGSIVVHLFGAVFGLAVSKILFKKGWVQSEHMGSVYHSEVVSFIGAAFLWVFWPSFNAVNAATLDARTRAIVNSYIALVASTVAAFIASQGLSQNRHFNVRHIVSAALAGGVALGVCGNIILVPYQAFIVGTLAGFLSIAGFQSVQPWIANKAGVHDTRGVLSLHAIPAVVGVVATAVLLSFYSADSFPTNSKIIAPGRTNVDQALIQLAGLAIATVIAAVAGVVTGLILKLKVWNQVRDNEFFSDADYFNVPDDFDFTTQVISHIEGVELRNAPAEKQSLIQQQQETAISISGPVEVPIVETPAS